MKDTLYSDKIAFTRSESKCVGCTVCVKLIPPLSFLLNTFYHVKY